LSNYRKLKKKLPVPINTIQYEPEDAKDPCAEKEERITELYRKRIWVPMLQFDSNHA
jgi:hypothetical protein